MKRLYFLFLLTLPTTYLANGQDIPLFSQKLTNSFMYNPAVAGHNVGSLTYSYRQTFGGIQNAPRNNFVSVHTPLAGHRIGLGINFYQEDVNFLRNTYASAAFAYHMRLTRYSSLSMGVSGEYNFSRLKGTSNSDPDPIVTALAAGANDDYDFSFGMLYQNRYVKAGVAANRLATAWIKDDNQFVLSNFYSGFIQGLIPIRGGEDLLEPYVAFRKFSETNDAIDVGLYYTYNARILAGASFRQGSVASATAGFYLTPKLMVGYTREMFLSDIHSSVGATNEFTLRFDFNRYDYKSNFSDSYKSALAYRHKSMGSHGSKSPGQFHRKQKKLASFSPNKRYQTTKKLSITPSSQRYKVKKSRYKAPVKRKRRK